MARRWSRFGRDCGAAHDARERLRPAGYVGRARLTAVYPRTGRRATIIARRESGPQGATIKLSGDVTGTLTVDGQGRLQRLDLPSAGILVTPAAK